MNATAELESGLREAAVRALEEMAFLMTAPITSSTPPVELAVRCALGGQVSGTFVFGLSGAVIEELTANMLGEDVPPPVEAQVDALREMANVVCGVVLPAIGGTGAVISIEPGIACDWNEMIATAPPHTVRVEIGLDGGRCGMLTWSEEGA